ncbi:MAG: cytochrome ubiquinol oxidase subunit I [Nitrospirae bacterium]|nr:cytochrome ubiquinol oxidase subunit I [Nitrospirota bacterium]
MHSSGDVAKHPSVSKGILKGVIKVSVILLLVYAIVELFIGRLPQADYRAFPLTGSRIAIWIVAQVHLLFGAFVLAVPLFALICEIIALKTKDERYNQLAYEFVKLLHMAFTTTAIFGALLLIALIGLYPKFFDHMTKIFKPTYYVYVLLLFGEVIAFYVYYYSWHKLVGRPLHIVYGALLNFFGISIMVAANAWAAYMQTPGGVDESGNLVSLWGAINTYTWMPINIHRTIANISYGGSIAGAYAAFRFLAAESDEERARYDWMGYVGSFIAIAALLPLPFAGYFLTMEMYAFSQQMGITLMGGVFSWLFIIQAVLIGVLFLAANYYLWLGMMRIKGSERYAKYNKWLLLVVTICVIVWMTPHSIVASLEEARKMGGTHHPILGVLGVMSAKNTAVNILILATFLSFILYKRANKIATVPWAKTGTLVQGLVLAIAVGINIFYGIYGYFVEAIVRLGFSNYMVYAVLAAMLIVIAIDVPMFKGARTTGPIEWGKMPPRSQYALFLLAITFTWTMGLMGYARSGIREYWHVYGILRDKAPDSFTPTLGYAANIVSVTTILFLGLVAWIVALGIRAEKSGKTH